MTKVKGQFLGETIFGGGVSLRFIKQAANDLMTRNVNLLKGTLNIKLTDTEITPSLIRY